MTRTRSERLAGVLTALAAAIVVIAIAILPFLTPAWVEFEQGRTNAAGLTGYSDAELRTATNAILHDLVVGPPEFAVQVAGAPVLAERERGHMRDVRRVFGAFGLLSIGAAIVAVLGVVGAARLGHPVRAWRAIRRGMWALVAAVGVAAVIATIAFDAAFEIFHQLFFPGGTYTFDPATDRLVQLFPFDFWSDTTIALGAVIVGLALGAAWATGRLARRSDTVATGPADRPALVGSAASR